MAGSVREIRSALRPLVRLVESVDVDSFNRLTCDLCDELEVLVEVKDCEFCEFGSGADEQVWDRRRSMLADRSEG